MHRSWVVVAIIAGRATVGGVSAQEPRFESRAVLSTVYVTARTGDGHLATGLARDDFEIIRGGRIEPPTAFSDAAPPLNIIAMFQTGYIPGRSGQQRIREVASSLAAHLRAPDRMRIGSFGAEVTISPILTNDRAVLSRIVSEELWARWDHSPLWDAMLLGTQDLSSLPQRRVLMMFANGVNESRISPTQRSPAEVAMAVASHDIIVYAIALNSAGLSRDLRDIAETSGGGAFVMHERDDPVATMAQVIDELHHQYVLGVRGEPAESASPPRIEIRCRRPGIVLHSRGSYVSRRSR